jgi:hypothetical protein
MNPSLRFGFCCCAVFLPAAAVLLCFVLFLGPSFRLALSVQQPTSNNARIHTDTYE